MAFTNTLSSVLLLLLGTLHFTVDAAELRCFESTSKYTIVSFEDPASMLNSPCFDATKETVFFYADADDDITSQAVTEVVDTYLTLKTYNVIGVDTKKYYTLGPGIVERAVMLTDTKIIGKEFGKAVVKLQAAGLDIKKCTFIGENLGVVALGYAARKFTEETNQKFHNVIAFDAANIFPLERLIVESLKAQHVTFLICYHTNPGKIGTEENIGTVDVYPNCGNPVQPGCTGSALTVFSPKNECSSSRAREYFLEGINIPDSIMARSAVSCYNWENNDSNNKVFTVSPKIDTSLFGQFFFKTKNASPFGMSGKGTNP